MENAIALVGDRFGSMNLTDEPVTTCPQASEECDINSLTIYYIKLMKIYRSKLTTAAQ